MDLKKIATVDDEMNQAKKNTWEAPQLLKLSTSTHEIQGGGTGTLPENSTGTGFLIS